jgi:hypothetical protein
MQVYETAVEQRLFRGGGIKSIEFQVQQGAFYSNNRA